MRTLQLLVLPAALALAASASRAQVLPPQPAAPSGSETHVSSARVLAAAAGSAASASYVLHATASFAPALSSDALPASASYALVGGPASTDAALPASTPPLAFGTRLADSAWAGGGSDQLFGFNLLSPSGPTAVELGGSAAATTHVVSNTLLELSVPPGTDALGNPLAHAAIGVSNALGASERANGFVYLPALWQATVARVGSLLELRLQAAPGSFYQAWLGGVFPGFGLPLPGFDGSLVVLNPAVGLTPLLATPSGRASIPLYLPHDPSLAGAQFWVQAFVLTGIAPLAGGFTRAVPGPILP